MRRSFQKSSPAATVSNVGAKCQKCLKEGHWTADCTFERVYKTRPSRTALLFNPKLKLPEASMVKDDFIEDDRQAKANGFHVEAEVLVDAEGMANELIESVKLAHRDTREEEHDASENDKRHSSSTNHRYRYRSRSRSNSRSPRYRNSRQRSTSPEDRKYKKEDSKNYSKYNSDSDFSSDSD